MKRPLLFLFAAIAAITGYAQTATNFTCNDCNGNNHDLFTELDAGKVIVITWVMPCPGCINAASTAATTVQGYASSNPGRVSFYMVDDYGNSTCSTLSTWAATNGIVPDQMFSNAAISMADYGAPGMPKTVVLGGGAHSVFYNLGGDITASVLQTAIDSALVAPAGVVNPAAKTFGIEAFPNPASNTTTFTYELTKSGTVNISLYNILGEKITILETETQAAGKHVISYSLLTLNAGEYFVKLEAEEGTQTLRFVKTN